MLFIAHIIVNRIVNILIVCIVNSLVYFDFETSIEQFYCNTVFRTTKVKSLLQMKHIENRGNKVPKVLIIQYRLQQFL